MPSLTNYDGVDAPFGILELGSTYMLEPARERQQLQANDPLAFALPQRESYAKKITVEWTEDELRLIGVVRSGGKNFLNTFGVGKTFDFTAAMFRRGDSIDMETINHLRAPGEHQQLYGMRLVQERMFALISQVNLMWAFLRAQLMSGGINYTDPETQVTVQADPGIPSTNYYTVGSNSPSTPGVERHRCSTRPSGACGSPYRRSSRGCSSARVPTGCSPTGSWMGRHVARRGAPIPSAAAARDSTSCRSTLRPMSNAIRSRSEEHTSELQSH